MYACTGILSSDVTRTKFGWPAQHRKRGRSWAELSKRISSRLSAGPIFQHRHKNGLDEVFAGLYGPCSLRGHACSGNISHRRFSFLTCLFIALVHHGQAFVGNSLISARGTSRASRLNVCMSITSEVQIEDLKLMPEYSAAVSCLCVRIVNMCRHWSTWSAVRKSPVRIGTHIRPSFTRLLYIRFG
jgi:hypothetical protein